MATATEFPREKFDRIEQLIHSRHREHRNLFHFTGAWRAVEYRFHAVTEYDERFTSSINRDGLGPADRYPQERDLFGFASNACSMFDAFHYAMFAVGSMLRPDNFKLDTEQDERWVNFGTTQEGFARSFGPDPVVDYFRAFAADPERADLHRLRNMLTHRAIPPRNFRLSVGAGGSGPSASIGRLDIELDLRTTNSRRTAVKRLLDLSVMAFAEFLGRDEKSDLTQSHSSR